MAVMASMTVCIASSSAGKLNFSLYSGHLESIRNSPSCGSACQISSVMNGMNGCRSLSVSMRT